MKRMIEYGANHPVYRPLDDLPLAALEASENVALDARLAAPIELLDITGFLRSKLQELDLTTIGSVLGAEEPTFMSAHYVGTVRARQMRNAAVAAVLEYLSG